MSCVHKRGKLKSSQADQKTLPKKSQTFLEKSFFWLGQEIFSTDIWTNSRVHLLNCEGSKKKKDVKS